jgi:hypothetical protein
VGVFSGFFLLDENVTLILCDNLLFQSINRINSACKISFDHRAVQGVLFEMNRDSFLVQLSMQNAC